MKHLKTFTQINENSWDDNYNSDLAKYIEDNLGRKAKSMYDPWIPVKILSDNGGNNADKYVILVVDESPNNNMKTLLVDDLTACRDKWAGGTGEMTDMNVIEEYRSDWTDRYELDGYKVIWENPIEM